MTGLLLVALLAAAAPLDARGRRGPRPYHGHPINAWGGRVRFR